MESDVWLMWLRARMTEFMCPVLFGQTPLQIADVKLWKYDQDENTFFKVDLCCVQNHSLLHLFTVSYILKHMLQSSMFLLPINLLKLSITCFNQPTVHNSKIFKDTKQTSRQQRICNTLFFNS